MVTKDSSKKASLATGVIVTALAAAMLIVCLLIAFDAFRLSNLVSASLERRAEQVASLQGSALLQPLADYETDVVEAMLTNLVSDPEMLAARVLDAEGSILVESGAWTDEAATVLSVETRLETSEDDGKEHLGSFHLQVSQSALVKARNTGIYNGVASLLVVALALWLVLKLSFRKVTRPLESMIEIMGSLTRGDTDIAVPAQDRNDEIGRIATAVEVFKNNAIEGARLEEQAKQAQSRMEEDKKVLMNKMADDFEASIGIVVERVSSESNKMKSSATGMSATAEAATQQSNIVVVASSQASANVQTVASATDELSDSISEIGRQSAQSASIADRAVREVESTNVRVQSLADSAQKIGQVIGLINDVAEQTNLLALNATIEAARAGDAGKGFAVVASEVKNLATQTSSATEEIAGQITSIQAATEDTVKAIAGIGEVISEINNIAGSIAAAVEEQSAATQEIARNVEQASTGTQEVSTNIEGVNQAVVQTGTEAGRILQGAGDMAAQSDVLKQEVSNFLANIRPNSSD